MKLNVIGYVAASFLSFLGNTAASVALPLVILSTTGSVLSTGAVAAATAIPTVVVGLLAGVVVDRANRRDVAVASDVVSAIAVAALPLVDGVTGLSLGWFIGWGIAGAMGDAPGSAARAAMAPSIARAAGVAVDRVVGASQAAAALAMIAGPALAGAVIATAGPITVLWVTAGASALAAAAGLVVSRETGQPNEVPGDGVRVVHGASAIGRVLRRVQVGWAALVARPVLVWMTVLGTGSIMVTGALQGLILPAYVMEIGQRSLVGWVLVAFALGALTGAIAYSGLATKSTRRAWFLAGLVGALCGLAVIALLAGPWLLVAGGAILGLAAGPVNSAVGAVLADRTPDYVRGRVLSLQNAFSLVGAPLGVLSAGAIAHVGGLRAAAWAGVGLWALLTCIALWVPSLRNLGDEQEVDDVERRIQSVHAFS